MEYSPTEPSPHDSAKGVGEENPIRYNPAARDVGAPIEEEFPPSERTLLDDDFLNTYGRDPEEKI